MLLYYWTMRGLVYNVTNKQGRKHLQLTQQPMRVHYHAQLSCFINSQILPPTICR
jgi:hypothetical protein